MSNQNSNPNEISTTACDSSGELVARRTIPVESIHIPDLWHTADWLREEGYKEVADNVLNVWHLAHDMRDKLHALADQPECTTATNDRFSEVRYWAQFCCEHGNTAFAEGKQHALGLDSLEAIRVACEVAIDIWKKRNSTDGCPNVCGADDAWLEWRNEGVQYSLGVLAGVKALRRKLVAETGGAA